MHYLRLIVLSFILGSFLQGQVLAQILPNGGNQNTGACKGYTKDDCAELRMNGYSNQALNSIPQANSQASVSNNGANKTMACGTTYNMSTPYNSNNGQRGCMFDVYATNSVSIKCFDANLYAGTTANYEIYYRPSTHVGFENSSTGWTLLGSTTGLTSAGNNLPTAIPINFSVTIPAGQTYSFYVTNDFGGGTSYTDGTSVGTLLSSDANITVYEGVGKSYPFGLTFNVRNFNGHIHYELGSGSLDSKELALSAGVFEGKTKLEWKWTGSTTPDQYIIEGSKDGQSFENLSQIQSDQIAGEWLDAEAASSYYRIGMLDQSGRNYYSDVVRVIDPSTSNLEISKAYPVPAREMVNIALVSSKAGTGSLNLLDLSGKLIRSKPIMLEAGSQSIEFGLNEVEPGFYFIEAKTRTDRQVYKIWVQ